MQRLLFLIVLLLCVGAAAGFATPPDPPANVTGEGVSGGALITWQESASPGVTDYRIYRFDRPGGPYTLAGTSHVGPPEEWSPSFIDSGRTNYFRYYYYVVRSWDGSEESGSSNEVAVMPHPPVWLEDMWLEFDGNGVPIPCVRVRWTPYTPGFHQMDPNHPEWDHYDDDWSYVTVVDPTQTVIGPADPAQPYRDLRMTNGTSVSFTAKVSYRGHYWYDPETYVACVDPPNLATIGTEQISFHLLTPSDNQPVDSRMSALDPTLRLDYQFGDWVYRGGLFAGFNMDGSKVGRSYLKFDLSALATSPTKVMDAYLYCWMTRGANAGTNNIAAYRCTDNTWTESTIKWSTASEWSTLQPIDAHDVTYATDPETEEHWERWNAKRHVDDTTETPRKLSLVLASTNESVVSWMYFAKRQYRGNRGPILLVAESPDGL